jgi:hypothetical protein
VIVQLSIVCLPSSHWCAPSRIISPSRWRRNVGCSRRTERASLVLSKNRRPFPSNDLHPPVYTAFLVASRYLPLRSTFHWMSLSTRQACTLSHSG